MSKISIGARNDKRIQLVKNRSQNRTEEREIIKADPERSEEMMLKMQKRKRDDSPVRVRRRCKVCSRPRGVYRKFGLCRCCLRKFFNLGWVPGLKKASW